MTSDTPNNGLQFSLRAMMAIITVACLILAFPGGYVLLAAGTIWMLIGATIIWVLMIFRAPIYRLLSGVNPDENGK